MTGERSSEDDAESTSTPTPTPTPAADGGGYQPDPDPERVEFLREIADDVRGETSESKQLANILYRTSDLYDEDEDTTPEEIVRNVKFILEVTEQGGLGR
ncbi:hypothetical protein SAMN05444422_103240 [Halobiforma haloterrestris]|uniref:Uncharacterized protein n=1 Tax=Natronobacterium haloterrestre TaxID=148448 RepID=A0A1I1F913_NATHA|nr:hypothetical protein [Halobiforma haloterrestris]SFB95875.1 hypothetical protein SAMN05444422_103240 [Halobiforma haloterrestris]